MRSRIVNWPRQVTGGEPLDGHDIGILTIRTRHGLLPGNVQHAQSFPFPVLYEVLDIEDPWALMNGSDALTGQIVAGAQTLIARGVKAVVGACGSFAYYQRAVSAAVEFPVFLSIMTQAPFLQQAFAPGRLGVICASVQSMNDRVFDQCGIADPSRLAIAQMVGRPEFDRMVEARLPIRPDRLCSETVEAARELCAQYVDIRGLLFQCSDLPPFAVAVQQSVGLPVFDMTMLIGWLHEALNRRAYAMAAL